VVIANEVADAFPVHRLVMRDGGFRERYVVWRDAERGGNGGFAEEEGALSSPDLGADLLAAGIALSDGDAIDVSPAAVAWFATAASGLRRGYAIVIDYGYPASELYRAHRLRGTVRAYYGHTVTDDPFRHVGQQDLTAHVDFTALQRAGEAAGLRVAGFTDQGRFLTSLGLGDFLLQLRDDPETTFPDYLAAQAAVIRLIDPGGMGRFGVLIMARDAPTQPLLRGLRTEG
jgi:SAM-dependent MidA family methyltransferase